MPGEYVLELENVLVVVQQVVTNRTFSSLEFQKNRHILRFTLDSLLGCVLCSNYLNMFLGVEQPGTQLGNVRLVHEKETDSGYATSHVPAR